MRERRFFYTKAQGVADGNILNKKQKGVDDMLPLETISPEMLDNCVQRQEGVIIDLRTPEQFEESHIKGAVNVPYEEAQRLEYYPKNQPLILYCDRGGASLSAAKDLAQKGYRTRSLIGGMQAYEGRSLVFPKKR